MENPKIHFADAVAGWSFFFQEQNPMPSRRPSRVLLLSTLLLASLRYGSSVTLKESSVSLEALNIDVSFIGCFHGFCRVFDAPRRPTRPPSHLDALVWDAWQRISSEVSIVSPTEISYKDNSGTKNSRTRAEKAHSGAKPSSHRSWSELIASTVFFSWFFYISQKSSVPSALVRESISMFSSQKLALVPCGFMLPVNLYAFLAFKQARCPICM